MQAIILYTSRAEYGAELRLTFSSPLTDWHNSFQRSETRPFSSLEEVPHEWLARHLVGRRAI